MVRAEPTTNRIAGIDTSQLDSLCRYSDELSILSGQKRIQFEAGLWSHRESDIFGWSQTGFLKTLGVRFFVWLWKSNCIIHTSHSWVGNSCWISTISFETFVETDFLLCTTISIDSYIIATKLLALWEPSYDIFVLRFRPIKQQFSVGLPMP